MKLLIIQRNIYLKNKNHFIFNNLTNSNKVNGIIHFKISEIFSINFNLGLIASPNVNTVLSSFELSIS